MGEEDDENDGAKDDSDGSNEDSILIEMKTYLMPRSMQEQIDW